MIETIHADTDDLAVSPKPNAMLLFNPVLATAPDERMTDADQRQLENLADRARGHTQAVSPLHTASAPQPPTIMFFGTADQLILGAELYRQDSEQSGNTCRLITYEGQGHGFFNRQPYRDQTLAEVDGFLVALGWLPLSVKASNLESTKR